MNIFHLDDPITQVKGVGDSTSEKLKKLNISTVIDIFRHIPSRYYDFSVPVSIRNLQVGKMQSFIGKISKMSSFFSKNGKLYVQATAEDQTGKITLTWFNNPFIKRLIKENTTYTIAGKVSFWGKSLTVTSPVIEEGSSPSFNTSGIVPIYPQTEGINSKWLRKKIYELLNSTQITDPLNDTILTPLSLTSLKEAYQNIHFPKSAELRLKSDKRLSFNEHLKININNQLNIKSLGDSLCLSINKEVTEDTKNRLPFTLTPDQEKAIFSIYKDLEKKEATHRLIQGDTGSGKTATIVFAANQSLSNKYSCAILAPTEILANQHYKTFKALSTFPDQIQLITGASTEEINVNKPFIYIGTHSLLTKIPKKLKHPLIFVAIDEQHKFGVDQRNELQNRTPVPHLFNLSATPIPRTVALGLLGDISISNITHKPINRIPTKTFVVSPTYFKKSQVWLTEQLALNNQIFVVCPTINDHETNIASVEKISKNYRKIIPSQYPVLTIHGKMKSDEQQITLNEFKKQGGKVLIATSLIEVGIDIPSANIMVIHSAERFGLASLHQLRGRVGRGENQGYCFLVPSTDDEEESERLQLLQKYNSGLVLAQKDLRLRGAGEIYGQKQHGSLQTRLKYFWSKKLFLFAKQRAKDLVKTDPSLALQIARDLETC